MKKILTAVASFTFACSAFGQTAKQEVPTFTLAWSEYPSWSAFDVAAQVGLIGKKGQLSEIEKRWGVHIELKLMDYDPCIQAYGSNNTDAVCVTNIDILSPSLTRKSVAILPTSTSFGGDALIVPGNISSFADLQGQEVYGLGKSVSEYVFVGILENNNAANLNIKFVNKDPAAASTLMQQNDANVRNIMVWNPFILQTLKTRKDVHVLGNSRQVPLEVIDMIVVGEDVLKRPGGENFAKALADVYYALNERLNDTQTRDETLISIGEKFSNLDLSEMRKVVDQTRFFGNPEQGITLFSDRPVSIDTNPPTTLKQIMNKVVARCVALEMISGVTVGYGNSPDAHKANLRFDPQYMESVAKYHLTGVPNAPAPISVPQK